ncbi:MAG: glutamate racemase [bacterium]
MIGIFDSGFGGLTILNQLIKDLPEYDYVYLGDSARSPYGNKSQEAIYKYTEEAVDFLFKKGCELVIVACNTASAKALRKIQQEYLPKNYPNKRVLGVIIPAVEMVAEKLKNNKSKKIGLIATRSTIESGVYEAEISKLLKDFEIYKNAAPLLVSLVEEGWIKKAETKKILKNYLRPLKEKKINVLILGCTHYPFLLKQIKVVMGKKVFIINTPEIVADKLKNYLERHPEIEKKISKNKKRVVFTTDDPRRFKIFCQKFSQIKFQKIEKALL